MSCDFAASNFPELLFQVCFWVICCFSVHTYFELSWLVVKPFHLYLCSIAKKATCSSIYMYSIHSCFWRIALSLVHNYISLCLDIPLNTTLKDSVAHCFKHLTSTTNNCNVLLFCITSWSHLNRIDTNSILAWVCIVCHQLESAINIARTWCFTILLLLIKQHQLYALCWDLWKLQNCLMSHKQVLYILYKRHPFQLLNIFKYLNRFKNTFCRFSIKGMYLLEKCRMCVMHLSIFCVLNIPCLLLLSF